MFKPGDKVHYIDETWQVSENGIIKTMSEDGTGAFVVFSHISEGFTYNDYTGVYCVLRSLTPGWIDEQKK